MEHRVGLRVTAEKTSDTGIAINFMFAKLLLDLYFQFGKFEATVALVAFHHKSHLVHFTQFHTQRFPFVKMCRNINTSAVANVPSDAEILLKSSIPDN